MYTLLLHCYDQFEITKGEFCQFNSFGVWYNFKQKKGSANMQNPLI